MVSLAKGPDESNIPVIVILVALYFSIFYNVEVISLVTLLENEFVLGNSLDLNSVNEFELFVFPKVFEQVDLFNELERDVPPVNGALNDDMLKYSAFYRPDHALISSPYTC